MDAEVSGNHSSCLTSGLLIFISVGFHEAIGDTMALAVNTPTHLEGVGLLPEAEKSRLSSKEVSREDIAYLFHVALQKVSYSCCHSVNELHFLISASP